MRTIRSVKSIPKKSRRSAVPTAGGGTIALKDGEPHEYLQHVFSANVRIVRKARGLSQEALGDLAGLDRTYVSSIERGLRNVSIQNIQRLAIALEIEPKDLVDPTMSLKAAKPVL